MEILIFFWQANNQFWKNQSWIFKAIRYFLTKQQSTILVNLVSNNFWKFGFVESNLVDWSDEHHICIRTLFSCWFLIDISYNIILLFSILDIKVRSVNVKTVTSTAQVNVSTLDSRKKILTGALYSRGYVYLFSKFSSQSFRKCKYWTRPYFQENIDNPVAKEVFISGSFNSWQPIPMNLSGGLWSFLLVRHRIS